MFKDRRQAGKLLARKLKKFKNKKDVVVIGITRGGAVVAKEISGFLNLSLDIIVIKKSEHRKTPNLQLAQ